MGRTTDAMRRYWDERARLNPAYYVDTSLSYEEPDMQRFLATGRRIVDIAYGQAPVTPASHRLAVEIGCGLGRVCLALRERFDRVVGYDIAPEMLRRAQDLVDDPAIQLRLTDGASLPGLDSAAADFVVSFTVFQHIPDPDVVTAYIREAGRVLAPGGVFAFQWNNTPGTRRWQAVRAVKGLLSRVGRGDRYGRDRPEFLGSRIPLPAVDAALAQAGLRRVGLKDPGQLFTWAWAVKD